MNAQVAPLFNIAVSTVGMIHRTGKRAAHTATSLTASNGKEENGNHQDVNESTQQVCQRLLVSVAQFSSHVC